MARGNGSDTSPMTEVRDHWILPHGPNLKVTGLRAWQLTVRGHWTPPRQ